MHLRRDGWIGRDNAYLKADKEKDRSLWKDQTDYQNHADGSSFKAEKIRGQNAPGKTLRKKAGGTSDQVVTDRSILTPLLCCKRGKKQRPHNRNLCQGA